MSSQKTNISLDVTLSTGKLGLLLFQILTVFITVKAKAVVVDLALLNKEKTNTEVVQNCIEGFNTGIDTLLLKYPYSHFFEPQFDN